MTRRRFAASMAAPAVIRAAEAPRVRIEAVAVISKHPDLYHGWPTVAARRNGDLLAVYSGGREAHVCPFGRVELMRSSDGGKTWSWPEVLMDSPIDDRDAGVLETPAGTVLVTTFTSLAYQQTLDRAKDWLPERLERWKSVNLRASPEQRQQLLGCWMLRSTDGGMTWSAPYRVPLNSPHGPVAVSQGRLLYAGKQLWETSKKVGVIESTDDGKTWRWLSDIPARRGDSIADYHELHAVEAADGRIIVHIRNHNKANERETLQCESADGGKSWTEPHPIGVWGLPSHLLRLRDGRLLMSYGYRRPPYGNHARISSDHGRTWSEPVVLSDDGASGDLGYPSTAELPDGTLLTLWYERQKPSPNAVLRCARWRLA